MTNSTEAVSVEGDSVIVTERVTLGEIYLRVKNVEGDTRLGKWLAGAGFTLLLILFSATKWYFLPLAAKNAVESAQAVETLRLANETAAETIIELAKLKATSIDLVAEIAKEMERAINSPAGVCVGAAMIDSGGTPLSLSGAIKGVAREPIAKAGVYRVTLDKAYPDGSLFISASVGNTAGSPYVDFAGRSSDKKTPHFLIFVTGRLDATSSSSYKDAIVTVVLHEKSRPDAVQDRAGPKP